MKKTLFIIPALVIALASCGVAADESAELVSSAETADVGEASVSESAPEPEDVSGPQTYAIGDVFAIGDFEYTVHGIENPYQRPEDPYVTWEPTAGHFWVLIDIAVTNTTAETQDFSSLLAFELVDAEGQAQTLTFLDTPPVPEGPFAANETKRGTMVFEVPDGTIGLTLNIKDVFGPTAARVPVGAR